MVSNGRFTNSYNINYATNKFVKGNKFTYLQNSNNILRELHKGGASNPPVDSVNEDARADRMRHRSELRLLVRFSFRRRQLPRECRCQPLSDLRRYSVRLYFGQLVIFIRQSSAHNPKRILKWYIQHSYQSSHHTMHVPITLHISLLPFEQNKSFLFNSVADPVKAKLQFKIKSVFVEKCCERCLNIILTNL